MKHNMNNMKNKTTGKLRAIKPIKATSSEEQNKGQTGHEAGTDPKS